MNIFKKIFNYFKKTPPTTPEKYNPFDPTLFTHDSINAFDSPGLDKEKLRRALEPNHKCFETLSGDSSDWKVPKKLPLRDSRGRFTKQKDENV